MHGFEEEQISPMYMEENHPLTNVRTSKMRLALYVLLACFIVLCILASSVKIPNYLQFSLEIKGGGNERTFQYNYPVRIVERYGQLGDSVQLGDSLLLLDSPDLVLELNEFLHLEREVKLFETYTRRYLKTEIGKKKLKLTLQKRKVKKRLMTYPTRDTAILVLLKNGNFALQQTETEYFRQKKLFDEGVLTQTEIERAGLNFANEKIRLHELKNQLNERKLEDYDQLIDMKIEEYQMEQNVLLLQQELLTKEFDVYEKYNRKKVLIAVLGHFVSRGNNVVLYANSSANLCYLNYVSDWVTNKPLLKLCVKEDSVYGIIAVPGSRIGKLKEGQRVKIILDSYSVYKWGVAEGVLQRVSARPDQNGFFVGEIKIEKANHLKGKIANGLKGIVNIEVESRTLLGYMLKSIMEKLSR